MLKFNAEYSGRYTFVRMLKTMTITMAKMVFVAIRGYNLIYTIFCLNCKFTLLMWTMGVQSQPPRKYNWQHITRATHKKMPKSVSRMLYPSYFHYSSFLWAQITKIPTSDNVKRDKYQTVGA